MNSLITKHFDAIEARLVSSPAIMAYDLLHREITSTDGKIRGRAILADGGLLELFEYVTDKQGHLTLQKYRFHWQGAGGRLVKRWDNVPHHPDLPNTPYHLHIASEPAQPASEIPDILIIIAEIENELSIEGGIHA